jgi:hypothetical protein
VTLVALAGFAILFGAGVFLIWYGLRRKPSDALPEGADRVLEAIVGGTVLAPGRKDDGRDRTDEHVRLIKVERRPEPDARRSDVDEPDAPSVDREHAAVGSPVAPTGEGPRAEEFFSGEPQLKRF